MFGGTGLLSGNKSHRTVPTVLCRSRGSVPSQNRACCFYKSGFPLSAVTQPSRCCGLPCRAGRVQRCPRLCPGLREHSWALSQELPGEGSSASSGRTAPGTARLPGSAPVSLGAEHVWGSVCPLPHLQHSKEHSSGLVLGSWAMASAQRITVVFIPSFWILGYF